MNEFQLEQIAYSAFATGHYAGKILRAYRPTGDRTAIDFVVLQHADAEMAGIFRNSCIQKRVVPRPRFEGEGDPVLAFKNCLLADVSEALITSDRSLPRLDSMTESVQPLPANCSPLGWLYHMGSEGALAVYAYVFCKDEPGKPEQLIQVRKGQLRHHVPGHQSNTAARA